jgi:hypothetical protein
MTSTNQPIRISIINKFCIDTAAVARSSPFLSEKSIASK